MVSALDNLLVLDPIPAGTRLVDNPVEFLLDPGVDADETPEIDLLDDRVFPDDVFLVAGLILEVASLMTAEDRI